MESKKMVMIPGPTPVVESVRMQMGREIQAFGDPRFVKDFKGLIDDLGEMMDCDGKTFVVAGTGTLAMEMAIANTTKRGDRVLVVSHGFFGDRFIDICNAKGLETDTLQSEWGKTVPAADIEAALNSKDYAVITVSHVDTSTGVAADLRAIGEMIKKFPKTLFIVDGVCSTAGHYENMPEMNIDILFTGSQKAFGVCPGLFVLWANQKVLERRKSLGTIPEYYIDMERWMPVMDDPVKYFATPAINLIWALKESVRLIEAEGGIKARYERHLRHARAIQSALEAIGLTVLADKGCRAVTLSNALYPDGVVDLEFRKAIIEEGIIVAGGLGPYAGKMFRMGHMGNIDANDISAALSSVERALHRAGKLEKLGAAVGTYLTEIAAR
ncbi:MAG: alanine--glyoxylate aminotransferase family protein [Defluviitaleaceae bacterium]|nr:alanine--glyoxylate aminotransferase family protein [Defluviitaleaceae bacterium]